MITFCVEHFNYFAKQVNALSNFFFFENPILVVDKEAPLLQAEFDQMDGVIVVFSVIFSVNAVFQGFPDQMTLVFERREKVFCDIANLGKVFQPCLLLLQKVDITYKVHWYPFYDLIPNII